MGIVNGLGTTFNLPNYVGELFATSPEDTPFTSAIGGLTGGESTSSTIIQWQGYDLRDAAADRQKLEGADAPGAEERTRFNVKNVVEIHQEAVSVSYTKLAATGQYAGTGSANANAAGLNGSNPVMNELDWQVTQQLKQMKRDIEKSFLVNAGSDPADNTTARKTTGILSAITTNVTAAPDGDSGATGTQPSQLTATMVLDLMQDVWSSGGMQESETATVMVNAYQKRKLTELFITDRGYQEQSRNVGGVNLQTFETDFGRLNIMLNRHMPTDVLAVVSLDECAPVFLNIPGKGFLFAEPLSKTGSAENYQLYGEVGLRYGNEKSHGKLTNLADTAPAA